MPMRRIAFTADPEHSQKLERIEELVDEATSNGRKVLVFSFYLDVLEAGPRSTGSRVVGVITGARPADQRQLLVDRFSESREPGVLVGQITAGGVGLNLQAASVVILCEPQVKPSLEDQAVKRAHRMGQLQRVQVHRLLTTDSVDERMLEILATKAELFARFAEQSEVADASPQATDVTEAEVAKQVIARERERNADALRARLQDGDPASEEPAGDVEPGEPAPAPKPRSSQPATRTPPAAKRDRPRPPAASYPTRPTESVGSRLCPSCDKPIDDYGHCACS